MSCRDSPGRNSGGRRRERLGDLGQLLLEDVVGHLRVVALRNRAVARDEERLRHCPHPVRERDGTISQRYYAQVPDDVFEEELVKIAKPLAARYFTWEE